MRELRTLIVPEERRPNENEISEALSFANEKHCIVELRWFTPHFGWKTWLIRPEDNIEELLKNLNIEHALN